MTAHPLLILTGHRALLALLLSLFLGGCTLLAPYDEVADRGIMDLITSTETFLARYAAITDATGRTLRAGKSYDSAAGNFYNEARGAAAALLLRASQKGHNQDEIDVLARLDERYRRLEDSHRLGPITLNSAAGLHRSLRALTQIQLHKKLISTTGSTKESAGAAASN